ncbi:MAG TPA: nitronate monooxygenase family protein [Candidatus Margulisiibacteriota bacterium]|nr:nitronate monooxygenase family protein [Candidatus Margulisiibacteriota bacterium]
MSEFKQLRMGELSIETPIFQGGMGVRVSSSSLASAVSNERGLGIIAAVGLGEDDSILADFKYRSRNSLVKVIRRTRELTGNPFGVNIMCALSNYDDLVDAAQKELIPVIISGAGLPLKLPSLITNNVTKLVPIVSSARAARLICSVWLRRYKRLPDAVVVEGPLAGGHLGYSLDELADDQNFNLSKILLEVIAAVREFDRDGHIPIIAAGGVFDGKDIADMIKLGASGVQMATRFVCTYECDVDQAYKDSFIAAKKEDVVVIKSPVGMPGRVINNDFVRRINSGERIDFGCDYHCLTTCDPKKVNYCIAKALINASRGQMDKGFAMCGSNAFRIDKIVSVKELMTELRTDASLFLKLQIGKG